MKGLEGEFEALPQEQAKRLYFPAFAEPFLQAVLHDGAQQQQHDLPLHTLDLPASGLQAFMEHTADTVLAVPAFAAYSPMGAISVSATASTAIVRFMFCLLIVLVRTMESCLRLECAYTH